MDKERLQSILNLAGAKENSSAKNFVEARKTWEFNQKRLIELRDFRKEYTTSENPTPQSVSHYQSTRIFLSQLSEVIDQQEHQVASDYGDMNCLLYTSPSPRDS